MALKLKTFVLEDTENLIGTDWMEKFKLYDMPKIHFEKNSKIWLQRQKVY